MDNSEVEKPPGSDPLNMGPQVPVTTESALENPGPGTSGKPLPQKDFAGLMKEGGIPSDLGKLELLCEKRLLDRFFLIETDRLVHRAYGRLADTPHSKRSPEPEWVVACIDRTIDELVVEEEAGCSFPASSGPAPGAHFLLLMAKFGANPAEIGQAARRFNGLPEPNRQAFFLLVRQGFDMERCLREGLGDRAALGKKLYTAFTALTLCKGDLGGESCSETGDED